MNVTAGRTWTQLSSIDVHLRRLAVELRAAAKEHQYASQISLLERIDVLLDRRLRITRNTPTTV